jgi:aminocarboxymuconate-semialdehyde decarboxylase
VVPIGLPFGQVDERFPTLVRGPEGADVFVSGRLFRTITRAAWDMDARLEDMQRHGITMQAISVMPELFAYWAEPSVGRSFCRALNEAMAAMVAEHPANFVALGTVPLQHLDSAIAALQDVRELGLLGVQVGSNVNGVSAGSADFLPFFQAAADLGLCVFVHAFHPPHWSCVADPPMAAAVNFPPEIGTCMAAVIANGFVAKSPGLRIGASHGGGTLPLHLPRMAGFWDADQARVSLAASPYDVVRSMWIDCLTYEPDPLRALIELVGSDRVMVGSDYPFFAKPPGYVLDELALVDRLPASQLEAVRVHSALSFLGLDPLTFNTGAPT